MIGGALGVVALAATLVLVALRDSVVFFYGPSEFAAKAPILGTRLRVGGLVEQGSVRHVGSGTTDFVITDNTKTIGVSYTGILPDLFREGQGIVAEGVVDGPGRFKADSVLAKHDETYMPREIADALKKKGEWRGAASSAGQPSASAGSVSGAAAGVTTIR